MFNSENRHIKTYGYLTNWNRSGYMEQLHPVRKYRVKVLSNSAVLLPENVMIINYKTLYMNTRFLVDNETYGEFHCSVETRNNNISQ